MKQSEQTEQRIPIKHYNVKLNNIDKIEQLLQEVYDLSSQQNKLIMREIDKLEKSTIFKDLDIDGKEKYGKVMNNYFALLQKGNAQKQDIARLMTEVYKHNGDVKGGIDSMAAAGPTTIDLDALRKLAKDVNSTSPEKEVYETKK